MLLFIHECILLDDSVALCLIRCEGSYLQRRGRWQHCLRLVGNLLLSDDMSLRPCCHVFRTDDKQTQSSEPIRNAVEYRLCTIFGRCDAVTCNSRILSSSAADHGASLSVAHSWVVAIMRVQLLSRSRWFGSIVSSNLCAALLTLPTFSLCFSTSTSSSSSTTNTRSVFARQTLLTRSFVSDLRGGSLSAATVETPSVINKLPPLEDPAETIDVVGTMKASEKLDALRNRMKELNLDVYLVPSDDPHLSGTKK